MAQEKARSDRILEEVMERKKRGKIIDVEEEKIKFAICTLGGDLLGFYGEDIKEILIAGNISYVPGCPDCIWGIINVRGDIESVLNLHKIFGLPDPAKIKNCFVAIASKDGVRSGILVDSVEDVVDMPISSINPPLSTLDKSIKEFVAGETTYNGRNVTIIDIGKIFSKLLS